MGHVSFGLILGAAFTALRQTAGHSALETARHA
jgi:hypothetical protein